MRPTSHPSARSSATATTAWPPRGLRRSLRLAALVAAVAGAWLPAPAPAHDWLSPAAMTLLDGAARHPQAAPRWGGTLWAGVAQGAPAAPAASDCRRPPATFDVAGYEAPTERPNRPAIAGPAHSSGAAPGIRGDAAPTAALRAAPATTTPAAPPPAAAPAGADSAARRDRAGAAITASSAERAERRGGEHARQGLALEGARPADEPVSAGMVDDNADFGEYLAYRARAARLVRRDLDVAVRAQLDVRDSAGRAVPDARVRVRAAGRELPLWARTDAGGRAWLMPQPDLRLPAGQALEVEVSKGAATTRVLWQPGQKDALQARLDAPAQPARLDLVFLVDATGSMGDEIDKLKRSMRAVADQIARLPSQPDLCFGLVAYRDRGDAFFVRGADLTHDLAAFQGVLEGLQAGGGGDRPEALNEALHTAVHRISWRGEGAARLVVLVADAPPHLDYPGPQYDQDLRAAQARGVKIVSVGASGLDPQGEFIFRQMAQYTGGRFVFLTYAQAARPSSGPGRETVHDVRNYSVETLDRLLVRVVSEEMARWPGAAP